MPAVVQDLFSIVRYVAVEGCTGRVFDKPQTVCDERDEMRVMADKHDSAFEGVQRLYEGLACVDVQMVRRLVQEQQMRCPRGNGGQNQAGFFTAREVVNFCIGFVLFEPESAEVAANFCIAHARHLAR